MATEIAEELAAVIAARVKAAGGPEGVREALRQTKTALNRLAEMVGALLVMTDGSWHAGGKVDDHADLRLSVR